MKDKEWLKDEVSRIYDTRDYWSVDDFKDEILDSINELDEPEVLSKQEDMFNRKKPAIPKFVADYLYSARGDVSLMRVMELANTRYELPKWEKEYDWISENHETFARAWLYGYTVEEEQKYRVLDRNITLLGRINGFMLTTVEILEYYPEYTPTFDFTEQEIKDYNENYWAFAIPVEELTND